jgi:hypothetical protein
MGRKPKIAALKKALAPEPDKAPKKRGRPPKVAKSEKDIPAAAGPVTSKHNEDGDANAKQAGFLHHRSSWNGLQAKKKALEKIEKDVKAALKADGYLVQEMVVADQLATLKGELKVTGDVRLRLRVAKWIGHPMGAQMDLFAQVDRTPAVDKAREDGKRAAMEHKRASPPHAPGVPQYTAWLEGFHAEQERQVKAGIKPLNEGGTLDDDAGSDEGAPGDFEADEEDGEGNPIASASPNPARPLSDFDA